MKPHSFFLLVNYLSSVTFSLMLQALLYQGLLSSPRVPVRVFIIILILATLIFLLVNFTAFLHYIFNDDVHSNFHKFYSVYQIGYSGLSLAIVVSLLIYSIVTIRKPDVLVIVVLYTLVVITALSMLFFFSLSLKKIIHEEKDEPVNESEGNEYGKRAFNGDEERIDRDLENQVNKELSQI